MNADEIDRPSSTLPEESAEELYDMAPCGYLSTTPDGRITKVNRTFLDWTGFQREELTGGKRFLDILTIGGRIFYETHFALLLRMHGTVNEIALDIACPRGRVLPTLLNAVQQRDAAGLPMRNRITLFNTTERRSYERELVAAKRRAEHSAAELARVNAELSRSNAALLRANEELGQFAYAASHDLQEPLRSILAFSQLLSKRYEPIFDDQAREFLSYIIQSSHRMKTLIGDLLAFSQGQDARVVVRRTAMEEVLHIALSNLHTAITESGAAVTHDPLPVLSVDAARIAQVFQNLVGNAIKYRKPEAPPRIHVSAARQGNLWAFSVRDNGMGFDNAFAGQVFGMFKRLHDKSIAGSGIGLAICKKNVEAHEGTIEAESVPGVGSTFTFRLPVREPAAGGP